MGLSAPSPRMQDASVLAPTHIGKSWVCLGGEVGGLLGVHYAQYPCGFWCLVVYWEAAPICSRNKHHGINKLHT
jgi:hypothetical protein